MDLESPSVACSRCLRREPGLSAEAVVRINSRGRKVPDMQTQVNTSNGVENKDALERWANEEIRQALSRFATDVTRVEVHLSDENHDQSGGGDKRCAMEARLARHQPVAVT